MRFATSIAIAVLFYLPGHAPAADEPLTTETLLARWEQAAKARRSMDVSFQRVDRDLRTKRERQSHGRFYWEAPGRGFYKIDGPEFVSWNERRLRIIDPSHKLLLEVASTDPPAARKRLFDSQRTGPLQRARERLSALPEFLSEASDVLPLATEMTAESIQKRFGMDWKLGNDGVKVTLTPKSPTDAQRFSQIDLLFDLDSFAITAHHILDPPARHEVTHTFDRYEFNLPPADRTLLLEPNVEGFTTWKPGADKKPAP